MTKFEEEAIKEAQKSKVIAKCYDGESTASDIGLNIKLGRATHNFPWLEFAKNWHSDEEFQEIMEIGGKVALANKNLIDVNTKLAEEIANLKSQLQQQALPVVPKCVGKYIEDCKKEGDCLFGVFADATRVEHDMPDLVYFWLGDEGNNDELFAHAWLDGYTVEKPQLFRVCLLDGRHTLTRRDPRKTLPFNYTFLWSYSSELKEMREINREVDLFTEQEIKSIDERYWQFAVPVEDGE